MFKYMLLDRTYIYTAVKPGMDYSICNKLRHSLPPEYLTMQWYLHGRVHSWNQTSHCR